MRNVILAVVVVVALTAAGVGGTLASWSDSETSYDNYIETGSIDLKVNGEDDLPWGAGVGAKVELECVQPCDEYYYEIEVRNDGQCEEPSYLYIHFKQVRCADVPPLHDGIEVWDEIEGMWFLKPEPEVVAEYGGVVDCTEVPPLGRIGDECSMKSHVDVTITFDGDVVWGPDKVINLACQEIFLGMLPPSGETHIVDLIFHLQQISEDDVGVSVFGPDSKWYYWPSNALMKDILRFDIEFGLFKHPID